MAAHNAAWYSIYAVFESAMLSTLCDIKDQKNIRISETLNVSYFIDKYTMNFVFIL